MPHQHGAEIPDDGQLLVLTDVVNSSAIKKLKKKPGLTHIFSKNGSSLLAVGVKPSTT